MQTTTIQNCPAQVNSTQAVSQSLVSGSSADALSYELKLDTISNGYDGLSCWFHPRAGAIPGDVPRVVLTMQKWLLKSSDLFLPIQSLESTDLGKTWTNWSKPNK